MNTQEIANAAKYDHGAQQKEGELKATLDFLVKEKVRTVLEIGCDAGGTLFAWSKVADKVYGIDLWHAGFSSGLPRYGHNATIIEGNSHDPECRRRLSESLEDNPVDFLFIDGDHTYSGVSCDFWIYKQFVRPGGFIGFHDICEFTAEVNDLKVHLFWNYLKSEYPKLNFKEFKEFPYNWGGIGILQVTQDFLRTTKSYKHCNNEYNIGIYPLRCDYPAGHNIGVASQHHYRGVYWW